MVELKVLNEYWTAEYVVDFVSFIVGTRQARAQFDEQPVIEYVYFLRWAAIPLAVGFAYIGYQEFGHILKREKKEIHMITTQDDLVTKKWMVSIIVHLHVIHVQPSTEW